MLYVSVICLPSPPSRKRHSTCALLERCVYGGQAPDAREERGVEQLFVEIDPQPAQAYAAAEFEAEIPQDLTTHKDPLV